MTVIDAYGLMIVSGCLVVFFGLIEDISEKSIRKAVVYGTVAASFAVEDFSTKRLEQITREDIENRVKKIGELVTF